MLPSFKFNWSDFIPDFSLPKVNWSDWLPSWGSDSKEGVSTKSWFSDLKFPDFKSMLPDFGTVKDTLFTPIMESSSQFKLFIQSTAKNINWHSMLPDFTLSKESLFAPLKESTHAFISFFAGVPSKVKWHATAITRGISQPFELINLTIAGRNIIEGLISGLKSKEPAAIATARRIAKSIQTAFRQVNEINSPSRVYHRYGKFIMQGLGGGLEQQAKQPVIAMQRMNQQIILTNNHLFNKLASNDTPFQRITKPAIVAASLTAAIIAPQQLVAKQQPVIQPVQLQSISPNSQQTAVNNHQKYDIHIHVETGSDAQDIALQVREQLEQYEQDKAFRHRTAYYDHEGY